MKRHYITPEAEQLQTEVQSMLALSLVSGTADPDNEVLVKDNEDWDIWSSKD